VGRGAPAKPFPPPWQPWREPDPLPGRKVLVLSHMFPHPRQPASGPFVLEQVAALRRLAGVDARVLSPRYLGPGLRHPLGSLAWELSFRRRLAAEPWRLLQGVPVLYPPCRLHRGLVAYGWSYRAAVATCVERVRQVFAFELVHAHTGFLDGDAGLAVARRYGTPLVITEHTGPFSHLTSNPLVRRRTLNALQNAGAVIAVSQAQRRDVSRYLSPRGAAKMRVIPNLVDMELFRPPREAAPDHLRPKILFAGGADRNKNPAGVLAALGLVRRRAPGARLVMTAGPGDGRQGETTLRRLIAESGQEAAVEYVGLQDRAGMARLMRGCDLLVLASQSESFGCVLIEAMSCGRPVVATDCGGPRDIVTHDFLGELAPVGDHRALAEAMLRVIGRLGAYDPQRIRDHARQHFSCQVVSRSLARLYDRLAAAPPERTSD